jgi:selenocysteine-specific elongation factor
MYVIGTAGHVDHGKSTLVHALTGIDPDRLREEKEREMTIDLGFAWLALPPPRSADAVPAPCAGPAPDPAAPPSGGTVVGVIDVPGHIDFIKNMLAGIGGIDAALLVVAADEGVMPQTREHLAILDLLQVPTGVVALTKTDAITEEGWLDLVEADLRDTLTGTRLALAPIVPVSARNGTGLDLLKQTLADVLAQVPARPDKNQPRLPIDRTFSVAGFGTVVTGTLSDGTFRSGEEVEILPGGLRARIRGMQTHKKSVDLSLPGSRLAINLTGVHPDQLARGMVVTRPGSVQPTTVVDVRLTLVARGLSLRSAGAIPAAGASGTSLHHNQEVDFFSGAAEVPARLRLLDAETLSPGASGWAQLRLEAPVVVAAGDRFIIRQASPSMTLGGGQVVNPHPARRWRRFQPGVISELETLARGSPEDILLHTLSVMEPAPLKALVERSGLDARSAEATLAAMIETHQVSPLGTVQAPLAASTTPVISMGGWHNLASRMADTLDEYHAQYPFRPGMPREELKSRLRNADAARARSAGAGSAQGREDRWSTRLFNELVARGVAEDVLQERGEYLCRPYFRIAFTPEQQMRVDDLLAAFRRQPFTPPSVAESTATAGPDIISALLYQGALVRLNEDVLLSMEAYEEMTSRIVAFIQQHGSMTVAQVRDEFNTSRKYALAMMEHLDERKVTRRVGDERILRSTDLGPAR